MNIIEIINKLKEVSKEAIDQYGVCYIKADKSIYHFYTYPEFILSAQVESTIVVCTKGQGHVLKFGAKDPSAIKELQVSGTQFLGIRSHTLYFSIAKTEKGEYVSTKERYTKHDPPLVKSSSIRIYDFPEVVKSAIAKVREYSETVNFSVISQRDPSERTTITLGSHIDFTAELVEYSDSLYVLMPDEFHDYCLIIRRDGKVAHRIGFSIDEEETKSLCIYGDCQYKKGSDSFEFFRDKGLSTIRYNG